MKRILLVPFFLFSAFITTSPTSAAPTMCTAQYEPVCGSVPVQCIQAPCDPVRTDFANQCMAIAAGATDITTGTCDGTSTTLPIGGDKDAHGCLVGAGYSWDASLTSCIRPWEYQDKVSWAHDHQITRYDTLADFKYGNKMTRQEAATLVTRAAENVYGQPVAMCKVLYRDQDLFDTSLVPGISRACGMGLMNGSDGFFAPLRELTRAEALVILIRARDGQKRDESGRLWYGAYLDRAHELGLTFANQKGFDAPITRGEFIEWMKTLSDSMTQPTSSSLLGDWKLSTYKEDDMIMVGKKNILHFDSDHYSFQLCNTISGSYTVKNSTFSAGPAISTRMACADTKLMTSEAGWDLDGATYSIQKNQLIITLKNTNIFTFER